MKKDTKCMMCGETILMGLFCSEKCKFLAIEEAEEIDMSMEFLFGKKTSYCKRKLELLIKDN